MTISDAPAPTMDCRTLVRQFWDFLDGELTPTREAAITAHLNGCSGCFAHVDFERKFLDAVHDARESGAAPAAMRARILLALHEAGLRVE